MTFIPPWEQIVETKKCLLSGKEFFVTNKDVEIYEKISPTFSWKTYLIPSPTLCPEERQRRRLSFRNERKLYHRKCDKTGNQIISIYSPDKPYLVYDQKAWWGDDWSVFDYGMKFDFEKGFFEQFEKLLLITPKVSILNTNCENSEYTNHTLQSRNCYLCVGTTRSENCYYSHFIKDGINIFDTTFSSNSENIYYGIDVQSCYNCFFLKNSVNCRDSYGIEECDNCHHCIGCYGLKNKEYHVFNKPVSREQFLSVWSKALTHVWSLQILNDLDKLRASQAIKNTHLINCENCYGDNLENGKNGYMCFDSKNIENARHVYFSPKNIGCIDCTYTAPEWIEYCGEVWSTVWVTNAFSTFHYWYGSNGYYVHACQNSDNIFWCASLKKARYCIFNKQYSVQEYETLCTKIIDHMVSTGEWGEHFPTKISPFWYDETVAQEYFPITEIEAKSHGWKWKGEEETSSYHGTYYKAKNIADYDERIVWYEAAQKNINEVLSGIIECEITHRPFKIVKQELLFYIQNSIPLPNKHPDQRHKERMNLRNPRQLRETFCAECNAEVVTTHPQDKEGKVVCEACYKKLVY
jgi:hypothetical protein